MSRSKSLIDQCLSGKSAEHLISSLIEDVPSKDQIKVTSLQYLPKGTKLVFESDSDSDIMVSHPDKKKLHESVYALSLVYPELNFVVT